MIRVWTTITICAGGGSFFAAFYGLMEMIDHAWHAPHWHGAAIGFTCAWGLLVVAALGAATCLSLAGKDTT